MYFYCTDYSKFDYGKAETASRTEISTAANTALSLCRNMQKFVQFVFVLKHCKCVCPLIRTGIGASVLPEVSIYVYISMHSYVF